MVGRRLKNGKRCDHDKSIPIVQRIEINKNPNKSNCLTTVAKDNILVNGDKFRYFTPLEYERLQTVPDNYTIGVSDSQRLKMLGNGWTVDVISHILKNIT
jgi:site-specific DNA-cytosine methylase